MKDRTKNMIKLIQRSKDIGDGWKSVGQALQALVTSECAHDPELFEIDKTDGFKVRLSETGKTVAAYL